MTPSSLEAELRQIGASYSGKWTCALTDLGADQHVGVDEDEVMPTASLIKVPILVALYQAVEERRVRLDARLSYQPEHRGRVRRMAARIRRWQLEVGDTAPLPGV